MRAPEAAKILDALELARGEPPAARALELLRTFREESRDELAAQPVGWIVARLLELRESMLGPILECVARCPRCGVSLETQVVIAELLALAPEKPLHQARTESAGRRIDFRIPTGADLISLRGDANTALSRLLTNLVIADRGEALDVDAMAQARTAIEAAIAEHDPLACIELAMSCGDCGHRWRDSLRPFEFVWSELQAAARRLTAEVAQLAAGFGWREADILAMSEQRRRRYLEMLPA